MERKQLLLRRLEAVVQALAKTDSALALIGVGSSGPEPERLDDYSDLDFFVVVRRGCKETFLERLDWLAAIHPLAYFFRNTDDSYKVLFADDVFCEVGVFDEAELRSGAFATGDWRAPGHIIWRSPDFDFTSYRQTGKNDAAKPRTVEWAVGEALTNLYVGLCRYQRGEKLSALRFIQSYAVDRIIELSELIEQPRSVSQDVYAIERRYEQRFPQLARELPRFLQGYGGIVASARAILDFLDKNFAVNAAIKKMILARCDDSGK